MFMWVVILSLLAIGLALIIIELIFIPGTTVVGLLGLIFTVIGISITYNHFGNKIGWSVLISTSVVTAIALVYSFRSGAWSKFSNKSSINSKVNEGYSNQLSIGDEGITLSTLRPIGNAEFKNQVYEVRSLGEYIESQQKIKIIKIDTNQIIVEQIPNSII